MAKLCGLVRSWRVLSHGLGECVFVLSFVSVCPAAEVVDVGNMLGVLGSDQLGARVNPPLPCGLVDVSKGEMGAGAGVSGSG